MHSTILLIGYGPFSGRNCNGSATLAQFLDGHAITSTARIRSLVLPVCWASPHIAVRILQRDANTALVMAMGEGHPERAVFEQRAHAQAHGADICGHLPDVVPEAQQHLSRRATLRFHPAWFNGLAPIAAGFDAGTYLCNRMLFRLLTHGTVPAGFMHVPPQGQIDRETYVQRWGPVVRRLLAGNVR